MSITKRWLMAGFLAGFVIVNGMTGLSVVGSAASAQSARAMAAPAAQRTAKDDAGKPSNVVAMEPVVPGSDWKRSERALAGVVLDANGKPAAGARVILCEVNKSWPRFEFSGNPMQTQEDQADRPGKRIVTTGDDGRFEFENFTLRFCLLVRHRSGVTIADETTFPKDGMIRVHPWGRVEGVMKNGNAPVPEREIKILYTGQRDMPPLYLSDNRAYPVILYTYAAKTDAQGRFVFDRIHSGSAQIIAAGGKGESALRLPIEIKPEGTTVFNIGGAGWRVTGTVALGEGSEPIYNATDCVVYLRPLRPRVPREVFKVQGGYGKWQAAWEQTPEGKIVKAMNGYSRSVTPDKDGRFVINDVPKGKYSLTVEGWENRKAEPPVKGKPGEPTRPPRSRLLDATYHDFDIPPVPTNGRGDQECDLGRLEIVMSNGPAVGDAAPDFTCPALDGGEVKLKDYRGRVVLLAFWSTHYGPYEDVAKALRAVWEKHGQRPDFAMISLSMESDKETPKEFVVENAMDWAQGFLGNRGDNKAAARYGVQGYPKMVLIGPDGRIMKERLGIRDIGAAVDEALRGIGGQEKRM